MKLLYYTAAFFLLAAFLSLLAISSSLEDFEEEKGLLEEYNKLIETSQSIFQEQDMSQETKREVGTTIERYFKDVGDDSILYLEIHSFSDKDKKEEKEFQFHYFDDSGNCIAVESYSQSGQVVKRIYRRADSTMFALAYFLDENEALVSYFNEKGKLLGEERKVIPPPLIYEELETTPPPSTHEGRGVSPGYIYVIY